MSSNTDNTAGANCPFQSNKPSPSTSATAALQQWWPNRLDLSPLHNPGRNDPAPSFDYARDGFGALDLLSLKSDLRALMTTSQKWWPADYGHYGPFFIRMAWHSAGTYRTIDGRGGANSGNLRFAPLNSWPDNANLDKAKRLLWPLKSKYGKSISWADLMILAGNVALESMGVKTFGFAGGREDIYAPEEDVYWGPERTWLADERRRKGEIEKPLGAVQMGLIYVNPEGPNGNPDPLAAAKDIRETFGRMAMNDEETVALIAGGHTFGKAHGAANADKYVGPEPEGAKLEEMGLGWTGKYRSGIAGDAISSGLEGAWTSNPIRWDNGYFENLFNYNWTKTKSPGGAIQWIPTNLTASTTPDAHDPSKRHLPIMFTTDLALRYDPVYAPISKRFHENPEQFHDAFAKAWYKLTHRDMGPISRCFGNEVPPAQIWQDPVPAVTHPLIDEHQANALKKTILASAVTTDQLVKAAWASASTYRYTDHRGGANGARVRLAPQKDWEVNDPNELGKVLKTLESVQERFNRTDRDGKKVSLADLIVLGGCAAVEDAASKAGYPGIKVPFAPGRTDATPGQTDVDSFSVLEPVADGFRNYYSSKAMNDGRSEEEMLVDKASLLKLTAPEMTVLLGGMRVLDSNCSNSPLGVCTSHPGVLTNDFFVNILDMGTTWTSTKNGNGREFFVGKDRATGIPKFRGSRVDLVFGSNSELRAISEYYATDDAKRVFVEDFAMAWGKVMNLDRFDLKSLQGSKVPRSRL